ncbi:MAG: DUF488 domain-containing protein [Caulobacteraceae bacterium]|nr:DUF488 domain-containing protein [Caulobacteraceae bacterium]
MKLYTIGYEGRPQAGVIRRLKAAGVQVLADVRAVAASRRAGFSKTVLAVSAAEAGIDYVHLRGVGTPKAGREAARAGRRDELQAVYDAHMQEPAFRLDFERLRETAKDRPTAILCFCGDHSKCHRGILSDRLAREDGFEVVNL